MGGAGIAAFACAEAKWEVCTAAALRRTWPCSSSDASALHLSQLPPHEHLRCSPGPDSDSAACGPAADMWITCSATRSASRSSGSLTGPTSSFACIGYGSRARPSRGEAAFATGVERRMLSRLYENLGKLKSVASTEEEPGVDLGSVAGLLALRLWVSLRT